MVEWLNGELPQWGYGEMSKQNSTVFLPSTTTFPPVAKLTNCIREILSS